MALSRCKTETDRQGRELAGHGTPLFPLACYHDDLALEPVPWHWHDELEVLLVENGAVQVGARGERALLTQGQGCFLNAGVVHSAAPARPGPCRLHSLVFHPRLVGGSVESIFWQEYVEPVMSNPGLGWVCFRDLPWERQALEETERAWQLCAAEEPGYELGVRDALSQVLLLLLRHAPAPPAGPSAKALRDGERIKVMLQYIQDHYPEPLTTARIAKSASLSDSECLRCFRSTVGTTPIRYVKQLRVQTAARLLRSTDWKVAEIGARCGFQEMSYFTRTFRALKGDTPSDYRAKKRND